MTTRKKEKTVTVAKWVLDCIEPQIQEAIRAAARESGYELKSFRASVTHADPLTVRFEGSLVVMRLPVRVTILGEEDGDGVALVKSIAPVS